MLFNSIFSFSSIHFIFSPHLNSYSHTKGVLQTINRICISFITWYLRCYLHVYIANYDYSTFFASENR